MLNHLGGPIVITRVTKQGSRRPTNWASGERLDGQKKDGWRGHKPRDASGLEAGKGRRTASRSSSQRKPPLLMPWFQSGAPDLRSCERIHLCCLSQAGHGHLLRHQQEGNTDTAHVTNSPCLNVTNSPCLKSPLTPAGSLRWAIILCRDLCLSAPWALHYRAQQFSIHFSVTYDTLRVL